MSYTIADLIDKMRGVFFEKKKTVNISGNARVNIKKIVAICNEDFSDQTFYGSDALNRKTLLDKRIADLLTPETILAILAIHANTSFIDKKSEIAIWRNSTGYISLAGLLFYGFNTDLDTIKLMPNNEKQYGISEYNKQKAQFENNTKRIVYNIRQAAKQLQVQVQELVTAEPEEDKPNLSALFLSVENTIGQIKQDNKSDALLFVPSYSAKEIRLQTLYGFKIICNILKIKFESKNADRFIIDNNISFDNFIDQFLSSDVALLHGDIIHLFYDRVHLEACLEQDTKFIFQNQEYYLRDIFREMVARCEMQPAVNQTAKDQLTIRLKLCDIHLREKFSSYHRKKATDTREPEKNLDPGYKKIMALISKIEAEIESAKWTCKDLQRKINAKIFLQQILINYDNIPGTPSLKKCFELAKSEHPNGFRYISEKEKELFFLSLLNEDMTEAPVQGPKIKNNVTLELEKLLYAILTNPNSIKCSVNSLNELEIEIEQACFNVTQILLHKPDFEHIAFDEQQLKEYSDFITHTAKNKPTFNVNNRFIYSLPTQSDFKKLDPDEQLKHLHYGEKLAIALYSTNFYNEIQNFLRADGASNTVLTSSEQTLNRLVPEILLCAAIATHGLSQPSEGKSEHAARNYRKERTNPERQYFKDRIHSINSKQPILEKGFQSSSPDNSYPHTTANTFTVYHEDQGRYKLGKEISSVSKYKSEREVLYPAGVQFQYVDMHHEGEQHFFLAKPIRTIHNENTNYTPQTKAIHELEIINKMFERFLIDNTHSSFRKFFDTVSNEEKLKSVADAKTVIHDVLQITSKENTENAISPDHLEQCRNAIMLGLKTNKDLVNNAILSSELGKTNQVLEAALVRINRAKQQIELDVNLGIELHSNDIRSINDMK